jgi:hypothetical protein
MQVDALQVARIVRWMNDTENVDLSPEDTEVGELLGLIHIKREKVRWYVWTKFAPCRPWEEVRGE